MATIQCRDCGGEVSKSAGKCPHCGAKDPSGRGKKGCLIFLSIIGALVLLIIVLVIAGTMSGGKKDSSPTNSGASSQPTSNTPKAQAPPKPSLPFTMSDEFILPKYKWQVDVIVPAQNGALPSNDDLKAVVRSVIHQMGAKAGPVERWFISFSLKTVPHKYFLSYHWERGQETVKGEWVKWEDFPEPLKSQINSRKAESVEVVVK